MSQSEHLGSFSFGAEWRYCCRDRCCLSSGGRGWTRRACARQKLGWRQETGCTSSQRVRAAATAAWAMRARASAASWPPANTPLSVCTTFLPHLHVMTGYTSEQVLATSCCRHRTGVSCVAQSSLNVRIGVMAWQECHGSFPGDAWFLVFSSPEDPHVKLSYDRA